MNLKQTIYQYISNYLSDVKIYSQVGIVSEINDTERSCIVTPLNGDSERKARLQASLNLSSGMYIKPVDGSKVAFSYLNTETCVIISYSQIESINLNVESDFIINGGSLGGLVKVADLVGKLNTLENSINDLKNLITAWAPVTDNSGASLKTALTTWIGSLITNTEISELENLNVKQ